MQERLYNHITAAVRGKTVWTVLPPGPDRPGGRCSACRYIVSRRPAIPPPHTSLTGPAAALDPAAGQLVEKLLIEVLVGFLASHGQEDVAADELVNNFAVRRETLRKGQS